MRIRIDLLYGFTRLVLQVGVVQAQFVAFSDRYNGQERYETWKAENKKTQ